MFKYILYCLHLLYVRSNDYTVRSYMYVRIFDVRTLVNMCMYNCANEHIYVYVRSYERTIYIVRTYSCIYTYSQVYVRRKYVRTYERTYTQICSFALILLHCFIVCTHVRVVRTHIML